MSTPFDTVTAPPSYARNRYEAAARFLTPQPSGLGGVSASPGSVAYLRDLMLDKAAKLGHNMDKAATSVDAWLCRVPRTQREVSDNIDRLKGEGYTGHARQDKATDGAPRAGYPSADVVPAGRYCIPTQDGALNELAFYKVDRPEQGRWAGYVFVNRMVGGNPDIAVKGAAAKTVLAEIAKDAREASARYGRESRHCGVCGTELTNDESRAVGIGPVCRAKYGW